MPDLPAPLPDTISLNGKTYRRIGARDAVRRGVCRSNDGSWHYYFHDSVAAGGGQIGERRHFSVHIANGQRSVHISLKPHRATATKAAKLDTITVWYLYDRQWTGRQEEGPGYGRAPTRGDANRIQKAVNLLHDFVDEMDRLAHGGQNGANAINLAPPVGNIPVIMQQPPPVVPPQPQPNLLDGPVPDSWEDL